MSLSHISNNDSADSLVDTLYAVETPEGIDLQAELAGPVVRVLAYSIDILIRLLVLLLCGIALAFFDKAGQGGLLLLMFILEWFYPVFFEVCRRGQTPGKKQMGLAVVNDDLTPVTWSTSMVRNLLRVVDFLPSAYLFGLISMVLNDRFARLGDLAAGTLVIHRSTESKALADEAANAKPLPPEFLPRSPPMRLELEEQRALVSFTQRQQQLTEGRQQELASILQDLCGRQGQSGVEYWRSVGAWLLGARRSDTDKSTATDVEPIQQPAKTTVVK